jgi:hypothetical protein
MADGPGNHKSRIAPATGKTTNCVMLAAQQSKIRRDNETSGEKLCLPSGNFGAAHEIARYISQLGHNSCDVMSLLNVALMPTTRR